MATWDEQWSRVLRWHERFRLIGKGVVGTNPIECYDDDVRAFFVSCYHLKDWIKRDPSVPETVRADVEPFVAATPCLRLAADVANGVKHLDLDGARVEHDASRRLEVIGEPLLAPWEVRHRPFNTQPKAC